MATTTSSDGTVIGFDRAGSGPPLILIDAAACFRGFGPMAPLAEQLRSRFTVFAYDRRGRGDSTDTPPYAVERELEDLQALLDVAGGSAFVHGFSSGAVLALHAAAAGLAIDGLALLEPALDLDRDPSAEPDPLVAEVADLIAAGRRGDAFIHFNRSIGVPEEMVEGLRQAPAWPALQALAHTLVYDLTITSSFLPDRLPTIATPTLVVDSEATDDRLQRWADVVVEALPNAHRRSLPGEWHGVAPEVLAPVLEEFFLTARSQPSQGRPWPAGAGTRWRRSRP
jgi:pimeloyl-ACP methyl ester carboxylesterase